MKYKFLSILFMSFCLLGCESESTPSQSLGPTSTVLKLETQKPLGVSEFKLNDIDDFGNILYGTASTAYILEIDKCQYIFKKFGSNNSSHSIFTHKGDCNNPVHKNH
jgi:hypothetical protein